jgi:hypothetical protein
VHLSWTVLPQMNCASGCGGAAQRSDNEPIFGFCSAARPFGGAFATKYARQIGRAHLRLTNDQRPHATLRKGADFMLFIVLSCLFGAAAAMTLWALDAGHSTIDEIVRRGGRPFPPGEP